ncbi:MAG TPA: hypothetical protein VK453_01910 [Micromonosporaceae bacterium]|nr:hypothetical protein [Micromonosporaceae bacterium]
MAEFTSRYEGMSHRALYQALQAGDPDQIEELVTHWKSIEETTRRISADLEADLVGLARSWEGAAGREYQNRVSMIGSFAAALADHHAGMHGGLSQMRRALADAKVKAEDPAATEDNDSLLGGAVAGATAGGLVGGVPGAVGGAVVGGLLGHQADEEQQEQARQRMVRLVSELAAEYDTSSHWYIQVPTEAPVGLPGDNLGYDADPAATAAPSSLTGAPQAPGGGAGPAHRDVAPSVNYVPDGAGGSGQLAGEPGAPSQPAGPGVDPADGSTGPAAGTTLAGADRTGVVAAGGLIAGAAIVGQLSTQPPPARGVAAGALAASLPPGGVLDGGANAARPGTGVAPSAGSTSVSSVGSDANRGAPTRAAGAGGQGGRGVTVGAASAPGGAAAVGGTGAQSGGRHVVAASGPRTEGHDDDEDTHDTWLTEDEMVWGTDEDTAPAVLGSSPPPDTD